MVETEESKNIRGFRASKFRAHRLQDSREARYEDPRTVSHGCPGLNTVKAVLGVTSTPWHRWRSFHRERAPPQCQIDQRRQGGHTEKRYPISQTWSGKPSDPRKLRFDAQTSHPDIHTAVYRRGGHQRGESDKRSGVVCITRGICPPTW